MTTSEIIAPLIVNGLFAVVGCFATVGAYAVKELTIFDADKSESDFQRAPSEKGRKGFLLFFMLPPFVIGAAWGLLYSGALKQSITEPVSYAIAMILGIVANSIVLKLNGMSVQEIIELIKNNVPRK